MKKLLSFLLALSLAIPLTACSAGFRSNVDVAMFKRAVPTSATYTAGADETASVNPRVQRLITRLKSDGATDDNGFYVFGYMSEDSIAGISCNDNPGNSVNFFFGYAPFDDLKMSVTFDYPLAAQASSNVRVVYESAVDSFSAFAALDPATFDPDLLLVFTDSQGAPLPESPNATANTLFRLGMVYWASLLLSDAGITMADIGFASYKK